MILVTLGTQKEQFNRLLDYISDSSINEEIIVQAGYTKYKSEKMKIFDFISYDEMEKYVDKASIIITHGGTGSIIGPLKKHKKVIACARLKKYEEHVDDHQTQIIDIFSDEGYILKLDENVSIDDLYKQCKTFVPKNYISNSEKFISNLIIEIENK